MQAEVFNGSPHVTNQLKRDLHSLYFCLCVFVVVFAAGDTQLKAQGLGDWPQFHNTNMQRSNPYETVLNVKNVGDLRLKWIYSLNAEGDAPSPAVADGVVYVVAGSQLYGPVYALNASTGVELWSFEDGFPYEDVFSSPAVANGLVYFSTGLAIYALNGSTGIQLWSYAQSDQFSSPTVANGVVYIGCGANLCALNASTGAELWSCPASVQSSPAVANGVVYVGSVDDNVYALNATTGAMLWSFPTGGRIVLSSPAVASGVVYVGSQDQSLYALSATTGAKLWSYSTGGGVESSPAVANGVVYIGSDDGNLYALNATTGAMLWSFSTGGFVQSSPAVANGVVYITSSTHNAYALDASTGAQLWSYSIGFSAVSPAVANGIVYFVGDLNAYAFSLPTPTTTTISSSLDPSTYGLSFAITAQVSPATGSGTPTGNVTFSAAGTTLGVVPLSDGIATLQISTLSAGLTSITASYGGDVNYAPSVSSTLSQQVNQATSVTSLASSANPSDTSQQVTFTATVTGQYGGTPTGTVTIQQGKTVLGLAPLVNAQGSLNYTFSTQGKVKLRAIYSGDSNYETSASGELVQKVILPKLAIVNISPSAGTRGGTVAGFTVQGNNFQPASQISFSGNPSDFTVTYVSIDSTQIVADITIAENAPLGVRNVVVTNPDGQTAKLSSAFTIRLPSFAEAVQKGVSIPQLSGGQINTIFQPNFGLTLKQAAQLGGYDHFNWVQVITEHGGLAACQDTDPIWPSYFPSPDCYVARKLLTESSTFPVVPFFDVPPGGFQYQVDICTAASSRKCSFPVEDSLPWYEDETYTVTYKPAHGYSISQARQAACDGRANCTVLAFEDAPDCHEIPYFPCTIWFTTTLVGVKSDGSGDALSAVACQVGVPLTCLDIIGTGFKWHVSGGTITLDESF